MLYLLFLGDSSVVAGMREAVSFRLARELLFNLYIEQREGKKGEVIMKRVPVLLASMLILAPIVLLLTWLLWVAGLSWWVGTVSGLIWASAIFALGTAQHRRREVQDV